MLCTVSNEGYHMTTKPKTSTIFHVCSVPLALVLLILFNASATYTGPQNNENHLINIESKAGISRHSVLMSAHSDLPKTEVITIFKYSHRFSFQQLFSNWGLGYKHIALWTTTIFKIGPQFSDLYYPTKSPDCLSLVARKKMESAVCQRASSVPGPKFWNYLPASVCSTWSLVPFWSQNSDWLSKY